MRKTALFVILLSLFAYCRTAAQPPTPAPTFTPTSGIDLGPDGLFSIGAEAFFSTSPNVLRMERAVGPYSRMRVYQISAALRPPDPEGSKMFKTDGLFRVILNGRVAVSVILKTSRSPANYSGSAFEFELPGITQLAVEFQQAGAPSAVSKSNMELQVTGKFEQD